MALASTEKLHLVLYLSIGLLSLPQLVECDKVRLVGPSRCSGRVEVFHGDNWGTVCDDNWSIANAEVVCREAGCGAALQAKKGAFFGQGKEEIWLDDVVCSGHETSIFKCQHRPVGENNCGHSEDAGVICSEVVRVVNGSTRCNGRVEVIHDGRWKRVCNNDWSNEEANVVCNEINCGNPGTGAEDFGESHNLIGVKSTCVGNETSISQCRFQEIHEHCADASVYCTSNKPIRLVNGTNNCSGRVEIFYNGQWGTVCDDRWGIQEASVACREMNCGNPLAVKYKAFYGKGLQQVWMDDVECTGSEKSLSDCPHRGFGEHDCSHNEDAGLDCSETVRLINGTDHCSGRLEVFHNGQWGSLCNHNWGVKEARIVCQELNCGTPKPTQENLYFGKGKLTGFTSTCPDGATSITQCNLHENSGTCQGVSLACTGDPPIRLVNGTDRCSGRVEILHNGQWGTVCDDEWDLRNAQVVCRAMDCGTVQTAKTNAFFGQGDGDIWLDDVRCSGNETSLLHCQHPTLGENNCGHGEDAGVVCSATIRLVNGANQCSGRVEVHLGDFWSSAVNLNWGMNEANVVCKEMNCGDAVKVTESFGQGSDLRNYKFSCNGRESSLTQCSHREYARTRNDRVEEAAVQCTGNVKLTGGSNRCAGRVEFYDKGQWGSLCGDAWDLNDAKVVCRQLNCGTAHRITRKTEFGHGTGQTWNYQIECNGASESTLTQCPKNQFTDMSCNTSSVAGVICTGSLEVRLANGRDECSGRVEVRHGDVWQPVCDADWTISKAQVVCELLDCGRGINAPGGAHFGQGHGSVVDSGQSCFDNVTSLQKCSLSGFQESTCGHERDAGVVCGALLRLVGSPSQCSGRVEIFHKGEWGTVCDDEWGMSSADVVCRQIGCGHAVSAPTSAHFGRGTGPIWLDNVECSGDESALTFCSHNGFGEHNCGHGEDAGVICLGALQKPQISISPAPEVNWGDRVEITCAVVSEQLGGSFFLKKTQGSFTMEKFSDNDAATFAFPTVDFKHKGSYFCEYQKKLASQVIYYPQGDSAELSVTVKLEKPSISLTSPHAMVIYSPDKISLPEGSSFSITCSTHSKYAAGVFYLTNSKTNTTEMKTTMGHSIFHLSVFELPSVAYKDQGEYNCVYSVNLSSLPFRSIPSRSLQVTIVATSSSSVVTGVVVSLVVLLVVLGIGYLVWKRRWHGVGTMVQFSNRFGGTIKDDVEERSNGALYGRDSNTLKNDHNGHSRIPEEKSADVDFDSSAESAPEDLSGKVCYELEPLVLS